MDAKECSSSRAFPETGACEDALLPAPRLQVRDRPSAKYPGGAERSRGKCPRSSYRCLSEQSIAREQVRLRVHEACPERIACGGWLQQEGECNEFSGD